MVAPDGQQFQFWTRGGRWNRPKLKLAGVLLGFRAQVSQAFPENAAWRAAISVLDAGRLVGASKTEIGRGYAGFAGSWEPGLPSECSLASGNPVSDSLSAMRTSTGDTARSGSPCHYVFLFKPSELFPHPLASYYPKAKCQQEFAPRYRKFCAGIIHRRGKWYHAPLGLGPAVAGPCRHGNLRPGHCGDSRLRRQEPLLQLRWLQELLFGRKPIILHTQVHHTQYTIPFILHAQDHHTIYPVYAVHSVPFLQFPASVVQYQPRRRLLFDPPGVYRHGPELLHAGPLVLYAAAQHQYHPEEHAHTGAHLRHLPNQVSQPAACGNLRPQHL